ncbi:MAG: sigma-54 dependent transcriptional regulator [Planctomycetota bacterium]
MPALLRILVVEKDEETRDLILRTLPLKDCELSFAASAEEAYSMIGSSTFTAAMVGDPVAGATIESFLSHARAIDPQCELFVLADTYDEETAVRLITGGAFDILRKPITPSELKKALFPFLMHKSQSLQAGELERESQRLYQYQSMVGKNPQMLEIYSLIERVGRHFKTALVTGETGTGKGLVAHALHKTHGSSDESFVYCSCPSMDAELMRQALIGSGGEPILVQQARGGTLFLDEVGELSLDAQEVLLEAIEHRGLLKPRAQDGPDIRIVASSARPLKEMAEAGNFRTELLARLSAVHIHLPALRERLDDIPLLAYHVLDRLRMEGKRSARDIDRRGLIALMKHRWPGNVRELEHVLTKACLMTDEEQITINDLPDVVRQAASGGESDAEVLFSVPDSLEEMERLHIAHVLKKAEYNKVQASKMLGISRSTLYQKMAKYRLQDPTRQSLANQPRIEEPAEQPVDV